MSTATRFTVVKFVPDPVANEAVNIGVVVFNESECRVQFLTDWRRARALSSSAAKYLPAFVQEFECRQRELFCSASPDPLAHQSIARYASDWHNLVQFEPPRASLKDIDSVFADAVRLYLKQQPAKRRAPDRRAAVSSVHAALSHALTARFGDPALGLLQRDFTLTGKLDEHSYDVAIANGAVYGAALGLSFAKAAVATRREIDALAFAVEDVRAVDKAMPLAVAYVADDDATNLSRARRIFTGLKAEFVLHSKVNTWAKAVARVVPERALASH